MLKETESLFRFMVLKWKYNCIQFLLLQNNVFYLQTLYNQIVVVFDCVKLSE